MLRPDIPQIRSPKDALGSLPAQFMGQITVHLKAQQNLHISAFVRSHRSKNISTKKPIICDKSQQKPTNKDLYGFAFLKSENKCECEAGKKA